MRLSRGGQSVRFCKVSIARFGYIVSNISVILHSMRRKGAAEAAPSDNLSEK